MARKPDQGQKQPEKSTKSKSEMILGLLRRKNGASIRELANTTGWQEHSIRGFLSGTVKNKLNLPLASNKSATGVRRYHIESSA